jgi:site-specific DNA-cytosine methylase
VAALEPGEVACCDLLICSPPCQSYSVAGSRGGRDDTGAVLACLADLAAGRCRSVEELLSEDGTEAAR